MKFLFMFKYLVLLSFSLTLMSCFEPDLKNQNNPSVTKRDFLSVWELNSIKIDGERNGKKFSKTYTGSSFSDKDKNLGTASIEFLSSGRFLASLHVDSASPVTETVEGDSFFSSGSMRIEAPGKIEWDGLAFKINIDRDLFVVIKGYDTARGGPFDTFYDHETMLEDTVTLMFEQSRE